MAQRNQLSFGIEVVNAVDHIVGMLWKQGGCVLDCHILFDSLHDNVGKDLADVILQAVHLRSTHIPTYCTAVSVETAETYSVEIDDSNPADP